MMKLATKIEAILYLKGQPLSLMDIAQCAECEVDTAQEAMMELISDYAYRDSALEVVETETGYSLQLRSVFDDLTDYSGRTRKRCFKNLSGHCPEKSNCSDRINRTKGKYSLSARSGIS